MSRELNRVGPFPMPRTCLIAAVWIGCQATAVFSQAEQPASEPIAQAKLLIELPEKYNTPDGMCLLPGGDVIVSVPNINDRRFPPVLLRIKPDNTTMKPGTYPLVTGVFRFPLEEAKKNTIRVTQPLERDPHCIGTFLTHNADVPFGADGVTMDNDGNLYVNNFADGTIHRIEFEDDATPKPPTLFAKAPFMKSADGLFFDPKREVIFVADSMANAIQMVFLDGAVRTLARDPENDGSGGRLDQPSEALVRGNELIICNFDMPVPGGVNTTFDAPHTISVIQLPESLR